MDRLLIAGTHSGCGKTTVTVAVIAALRARGIPVSSFKCGPDYIDPMFHRAVLGVPAHNLDPFFADPAALRRSFVAHTTSRVTAKGGGGLSDGIDLEGRRHTAPKVSVTRGVVGSYDGIRAEGGVTQRIGPHAEIGPHDGSDWAGRAHTPGVAVIEGVMGLYDGIGPEGRASTFEVAVALNSPVVLVLDPRGQATSAGAAIEGFARFRADSRIDGVIFNGVRPSAYPLLAEVARRAGAVPLGFLPRQDDLALPGRHLGLVTAAEIDNLGSIIARLGELAEAHLDLDGRLALTAHGSERPNPTPETPTRSSAPAPASVPIRPRIRLGVARDQAFCFVFEETLEAFEALGCAIVPFSPLADVALPPDLGGLYLPGGYPEVHAAALAANTPLLQAVHAAVTAGLPTIAECGGFMYLHDEIDGHPMAGAIPGRAYPTGRLCRFGYVTLTARRDNLLCRQGESLPAHEFHYYDSTNAGDGFEAVKASGTARYTCAHTSATLYAGFPHLALAARPAAAARFVAAATEFAASHRDGPLTTLTRSTSDEHVIWGPSPCDVEGVER